MSQARITKPLGNHFNWLIIYVPNRCTWPIWIQLHCVLLLPAQASPSLWVWGSHSSFCPAPTTDVTVKKEMNDSGCLSSRGLLDLRLSLIPDGYSFPEQGTWIWPFSGSFALNYLGAWVQEKHRFQWRRKIVYLSGVFKVFSEKQRLAYIKVAHKKLPIILNMKICQELHAKWICIYQSCTYSPQLGNLNCIKNGNTEFLDADNWMLEKYTQTTMASFPLVSLRWPKHK